MTIILLHPHGQENSTLATIGAAFPEGLDYRVPINKCFLAFFLFAVKRRNFKDNADFLQCTMEIRLIDSHFENLALKKCEPREFGSA